MEQNDPVNADTNTPETRLSWHPAFVQAIQLELDQYRDTLQFIPEYQLTAEPLRIDVVIIKKIKNITIKKNIAAIFRGVNLLEYKNPDDYVSVEDFYKVYGYACLYASLNKVPVTDLSLSFVESRYPRELIKHLEEERKYHIEEKQPGIYTIEGDIIPIQLIENKKLSESENLWLKDLSNKLDVSDIRQITEEILRRGKAAQNRAYLEVIYRANLAMMKEAFRMSDAVLTFDKVLEDLGLTARWEARGEARGEAKGEEARAVEIAKKLILKGLPLEDIVEVTKLDAERVRTLYPQPL